MIITLTTLSSGPPTLLSDNKAFAWSSRPTEISATLPCSVMCSTCFFGVPCDPLPLLLDRLLRPHRLLHSVSPVPSSSPPCFQRTHHQCTAPSEAFAKLFSSLAPGCFLPSELLWLFEPVCGVPAFQQASNFSRQPFLEPQILSAHVQGPCTVPTLWCEQSLSPRSRGLFELFPDSPIG